MTSVPEKLIKCNESSLIIALDDKPSGPGFEYHLMLHFELVSEGFSFLCVPKCGYEEAQKHL